MNASKIPMSKADHGFSLIEVLIAVLVLAIGMLGLGAVFPAIIAEQRDSFEVVEGENAAAAAAALLTNREMVDFRLIDSTFGKRTNADNELYISDWIVPQGGSDFYGWSTSVPGYYVDDGTRQSQEFAGSQSGTWSFNANRAAGDANTYPEATELPVRARLYPQPFSGKSPRFVWDVALRRELSGNRLQAAIFVRRIDARIRIPKDYTLDSVLTGGGGINQNLVRLPVALSPTGQPAADTGTNGEIYAAIQMLEVQVDDRRLDWLILPTDQPIGSGNADSSIDLATKVGQKLVDNTGVVRTVVGTPAVGQDAVAAEYTGNARIVQVDPPFLPENAGGSATDQVRPDSNTTFPSTLLNERAKRASWVRQVIFTPRTPVAVRVITLGDNS
ncbi:MAG: hypothetical protein CMJ35_13740 [Phycisphaerae bacterium]|nr:hypothetical protein [Phycisphaerae bacterium]MBM91480.1 hypothetical protein [Phycisphaerae bacterium]MBM92651.1 hypothetical protein [Phycisphaerae bacterium]